MILLNQNCLNCYSITFGLGCTFGHETWTTYKGFSPCEGQWAVYLSWYHLNIFASLLDWSASWPQMLNLTKWANPKCLLKAQTLATFHYMYWEEPCSICYYNSVCYLAYLLWTMLKKLNVVAEESLQLAFCKAPW